MHSKTHVFQQRWIDDYGNVVNESPFRLKIHCDACVRLGIEPKVVFVNGEHQHEKTSTRFATTKNATSVSSSSHESGNNSSINSEE